MNALLFRCFKFYNLPITLAIYSGIIFIPCVPGFGLPNMLCLVQVLVVTLLACFVAIYHYATEFLLPCESGLTSRRGQPDLVQCFPSPCTLSSSANWGFHVTNARSSAVGNESTELGDIIRLMRMRRIDTILSSVGSRTDVHNW